jgi:hypothetical protein
MRVMAEDFTIALPDPRFARYMAEMLRDLTDAELDHLRGAVEGEICWRRIGSIRLAEPVSTRTAEAIRSVVERP